MDEIDNCMNVPNANQIDTDNDYFGNARDADFNNGGIVDSVDQSYLTSVRNTNDKLADLNSDGFVNNLDETVFNSLVGFAPGPGAAKPTGINLPPGIISGTISQDSILQANQISQERSPDYTLFDPGFESRRFID